MKNIKLVAAVTLSLSFLVVGCAANQEASAPAEASPDVQSVPAGKLVTEDTWTKAAEKGMSAAFGTLRNDSQSALEIVSVTDLDHGVEIEIHDTLGEGTAAKMVKHEGALVVEPGASVILEPGGTHFMYMGLEEPLVAAQTSNLRLNFADGDSQDVKFPIRNFTGANESYHGEHVDN